MRDPSQFYDEQRHRRLMPKQDLSEEEIKNLLAFLDWVSKVDNQGWPPRPTPGDRRHHSGNRHGRRAADRLSAYLATLK